jgi:hypothetical protein
MSIGVAVFIFGAILLLIALLGGGFEVKELKVPQVNQVARMIATGTGIIFIVTGIILGMRPPQGPPPTIPGTPPTAASPTTAATTRPLMFPTAQEQALLRHVPKNFRETCRRATGPPQAYAKVVCTPSTDAKSVGYYRFITADKMYRWYFDFIDTKSIDRGKGNCYEDTVAEHTYPLVLTTLGRLACYRDGGKSFILWTHEKLLIGSLAYREDLRGDVLYQWQLTAGPLDPGVA